jgi:hypothetical protein
MYSFKQNYKKLKKTLVFLFLGFLAFAPPGTMIGIFLILTALLGKFWLIAGIVFTLLVSVVFLIFKRSKRRPS